VGAKTADSILQCLGDKQVERVFTGNFPEKELIALLRTVPGGVEGGQSECEGWLREGGCGKVQGRGGDAGRAMRMSAGIGAKTAKAIASSELLKHESELPKLLSAGCDRNTAEDLIRRYPAPDQALQLFTQHTYFVCW